jgi:hypothetical protein
MKAKRTGLLSVIALSAAMIAAPAVPAPAWRDGTIADINRVIRLVVDGRAEIEGRLPDAWMWRCVDPKGCDDEY